MAEGERVDSGAMCGGGWQMVAAGSIECENSLQRMPVGGRGGRGGPQRLTMVFELPTAA